MNISNLEKDELIEVMTIAIGNASAALSKMAGKKIRVFVPDIFVGAAENIQDFFGNRDVPVTMVLVRLDGRAAGFMLLVFSPENAASLAGILTNSESGKLDDFGRSALKEAGNILSGNCFAAISKFIDFQITQSVPDSATDMFGSVTDSLIAELGIASGDVLALKIGFRVEGDGIDGQFIFMFDPGTTMRILQAIKRKFGYGRSDTN